MKVTYCGPMAAVELPGVGVVARGATVEVEDALGKELAARVGEWIEAVTERKARKGGE
jgi:hypothetical protein